MSDLASMTAQPRVLTIAGKAYAIHPLTLDDLGALQAWMTSRRPDPLVLAKASLEGMPVEAQKFLLKEALDQARRVQIAYGSPEGNELMESIDGVKEITYLAIRRGDPSFTRVDAARLYAVMTMADMAQIVESSEVLGPVAIEAEPEAGADGPNG